MVRKRLRSYQGEFLLFYIQEASYFASEERLADKVFGVSKSRFSKWMNGHERPEHRNLITAAQYIHKHGKSESDLAAFERDFIRAFKYLERKNDNALKPGAAVPELARLYLEELGEAEQGRSIPRQFLPRPPEYVARPNKLEEIKTAILSKEPGSRNVALTTVLHGFGGFGKTTLAKEIYNDPDILKAFPQGVYWIQCEQNLSLRPEALVEAFLRRFLPSFDGVAISDAGSAKRELAQAVTSKQVLLIVDDVWYHAHAEVFRDLPPPCVVLMTTRMRHLSSPETTEILVDEMEPDEAVGLLASNLTSGGQPIEVSKLEAEDLRRLANRLGCWAQLLALANGRIRASIKNSSSLSEAIIVYLGLFEKRGIVVADSRDLSGSAIEARANAMRLCVDASMQMLSDFEKDHFYALGVLPKDADIPIHVVSDYWHVRTGVDQYESQDLLEALADMSLLQLSLGERGRVELHDNIIDYLDRRMDAEARKQAHLDMIRAIAVHCEGMWHKLPGDHQYGWLFLLRHLKAAGQQDQADECRTDFLWLKGKLNAVGAQELYRSFIPEPKRVDTSKAGRAIALSLAAVGKCPKEFAHQLFGRLGHEDLDSIKRITDAAREDPNFFPVPLRPHLSPIGPEKMRFVGHHRTVNGAVFSKDGRYIVTASNDRTARLWDTETGAEIRSFEGHDGWVWSAVFSKDGRHILTASEDRTARLWDTETGAEIRCFKGHEDDVMIAAFSEDGRYVVTASDDRMVRLWDTNTGAEIRRFGGHQGEVRSAVFSKDGRYVLTASTDGTARLWDTETGAEIRSFEGHDGWVWSAVFSKDGHHVLTASSDSTVRLWDTETGAEIRCFEGHESWVWSAVFSKDGRYVLTASTDRTARLWDTATGVEIRSFEDHDDWVRSAVFSEDSRYILIASDDRTARLWDIETSGETPSFKGQDGVIRNAVFSEDGRHVLTASSDSTARLWDTKTGAEIHCFKGHQGEVMSAVFSEDACSILSASEDGIVRLWDTKSGAEIRSFKGHQGEVFSAVFSKDGRYVLTASGDRTARLWDTKTGAEIHCFKGHDGFVHSAVFSEDGRHALTASEDFKARLWDIETGVEIRCFKGHGGQVLSAILSRDGRHVLTASTDRTARLWDTKTGAEVRSFKGHKRPVVSAVFSKVGCHILTASTDGTARLWDAETGAEVRSFKGYLGRGPSAVFSKDGRLIITASEDGTARLWDASTGTLLHMLTLDSVPTALATSNENLSVGTASGQLFCFSF